MWSDAARAAAAEARRRRSQMSTKEGKKRERKKLFSQIRREASIDRKIGVQQNLMSLGIKRRG